MRLPRLPDLLTTANLCCGVASILLASQGQLTIACGLIFLAAVFDVFDGLAARAMGGGSPLGAQLDSLADMVSFGVAPGMLVFVQGMPTTGIHVIGSILPEVNGAKWIIILAACLIPVASAWRLAKFNIDTRQSTGFLGLPTPANAMFWASLLFGPDRGHYTLGGLSWEERGTFKDQLISVIHEPWVLLGLSFLLGILMLSELPLPSLKFKHKGWKGNEVIFLLIGIGAVLVLLYGILAVPLILIIYLLSPLWGKLFKKPSTT